MPASCIVLLGGSFDPVHTGHVAIAEHFCKLFQTRRLRLIPAGNPWQKPPLQATPAQRIAMLELAFRSSSLSVAIDTQEIERPGPSYTVETLRAIRRETSDTTSLIFIIGADQLKNLDSWHEWKQLFDYANIAVAARPGFSLDSKDLSPVLYETFHNRLAAPQEISTTPHGLTCFSGDTALPVSSGEIRKNLRHSGESRPPVPPEVLDYIVTHNLYRD